MAKMSVFGGNENVIIAEPEISQVQVENETDFLIIGCDGLFDKLQNK